VPDTLPTIEPPPAVCPVYGHEDRSLLRVIGAIPADAVWAARS
jgi:hypothetical protein